MGMKISKNSSVKNKRMEISKNSPIKNKRNLWKSVSNDEYQVNQFILS
jgi:hypothetical protein